MTNLNATACRQPAARPRPAARALLRAASVIFGPVAQAYRARRDTERLMNLNDHLLNDLGITRRDIDAVVRMGREPRG
jgi:uncharacterized protein YjiS (DUF1127 family)